MNLPAAGVVVPMAGGDARYVLKPAPLTALLAASVVNEPVLPLIGALVTVPPEMVGALSVGDVPNTADPLPVSSDSTPASCAEVVDANCASVPFVNAKEVPHDRPVPLVY